MARRRSKADDYAPPSRSQKKRDSHALQGLGAKLMTLPQAELHRLDLDRELVEAIIMAKKLNPRTNGWRRQVQFIGKLMRGVDPEPLLIYFGQRDAAQQTETDAFHRLEAWRDRLLDGDESALAEVAEAFPHLDEADMELLAETAFAARAELENRKPPRHARMLFRYLRQASEGPPPDDDDKKRRR